MYDENGQPHDLGVSDSILRYGAFLGGGMVYGGWNQYRVALPAGISVSKIEVCVVWVEEYAGMGPMPFYFDDFKVLTLKDEEPRPHPPRKSPRSPLFRIRRRKALPIPPPIQNRSLWGPKPSRSLPMI